VAVRWIYSLFLFLSLLFYAPVYFFRLKIGRGERLHLRQRLGLDLPPANPGRPLLWIHAVSVGEVLSLRTLLAQVKRSHPDWLLYFSVLTNTGCRVAREKLSDADQVFFLPLDFTFIVNRFFSAVRPDLFILAESEFWPNLLRAAGKYARAVLLINGRISLRSYNNYRRLRPLARRLLAEITLFLVQTATDKERLAAVGVDPERIMVAGNLKADVVLPRFSPSEIGAIKASIGIPPSMKIIVAGSTHRGEEGPLLLAFRQAKATGEGLLLIVAPRHPQRSEEVEAIALAEGLKVKRRTEARPDDRYDVLVLDTIGELAHFYALCDLAFVGGSLIPHGGQNILEPAFYKKPIFFGAHMDNFASLAEEFIRAGGARLVSRPEEITAAFRMLDDPALQEMGRQAGLVLDSLRGGMEKTVREIEALMRENEKKRPF
jgi:3-deoxy-D-manno-octulosonic-acid transferase